MIQWTPRLFWDDGEVNDETLELPVGLWRHSFPAIGGDIESDAGFPASFVVRRDYCVEVPFRFFEEEWPTMRALVAHGQAEGVIVWYPHADDLTTFYNVYLESPALGEDVRPLPDGEYPAALSLVLTFRRVDGGNFDDLLYFEAAA